jgi:ribose 5-phosphate isomerase RpiB
MMAIEEALEIVDLWLATEFEGGRHQGRIDKLDK